MEIIPHEGISITSIVRGIIGLSSIILIAYLLSNNKKRIDWKTIIIGLSSQLVIAVAVLRIEFVRMIFEKLGQGFLAIVTFTNQGSKILFGELADSSKYGEIFVFQVLPVIIFFSALTSVLYYYRIIQKVVSGLAWMLTKFLNISGQESLAVAGNIFLGQTEAPLLVKGYLDKMNKSEYFLLMTGGMATVAGSVLAAYIGFLGGDDPVQRIEVAKNLIIASVMAAPGAIVISKLMFPQTEEVTKNIEISTDVTGTNLLSAITNGTRDGIKMAVNVGAMLLVFLALIALVNGIFYQIADVFGLNNWIEQNTDYQSFSLELILGYLFAPLMWLIGIAVEDMYLMGQLLGIKLAASEFVAYIELASLQDVGNALHLTYQKSVIMATIMLCGFANFASIGIQIGGIGILAPGKSKLLTELGFKAMIAGTLVSLLSATFVGMLLG
ncbi:Na+ dependent nucleoside transporter [Flavobacteriaceae bacterium]|nr:Na+ dependent nucleoside transporter [Flavobacteriaceae bacterium]MDA9850531.1 Na+ dependent nucleoside transporter [Flavobacteriaceae bacterium]MDB2366560.1 Na+ dependent nucleoside transporter [Flavobacteriaceae bacterium]MDB3874135.1 Na+ dependent nucleoside transporter [Flavobacteriaceae bacterium]MDB4595884.1 Na+ dependent nucleoside transporter [Flavobacteriaceae bacterium]